MLKKRMSAVLSAIWLVCMVTSCGRHAMPNFESADTLAREIYHTAGLDMDGVYGEVLGEHSAYCAGMSEDEFRSLVESAVVYRKMIDSDGQTLYVFQMKSERVTMRKSWLWHVRDLGLFVLSQAPMRRMLCCRVLRRCPEGRCSMIRHKSIKADTDM